jgi:hypothetical protein
MAARQANASINAGSWLAYDDVIDPRDLRNALLAGLALAEGRQTTPRSPRMTRILP